MEDPATAPPCRQTTSSSIEKGEVRLVNGLWDLSPSLEPATAFPWQQTRFPSRHLAWALSMGAWGLQVTKTLTPPYPLKPLPVFRVLVNVLAKREGDNSSKILDTYRVSFTVCAEKCLHTGCSVNDRFGCHAFLYLTRGAVFRAESKVLGCVLGAIVGTRDNEGVPRSIPGAPSLLPSQRTTNW